MNEYTWYRVIFLLHFHDDTERKKTSPTKLSYLSNKTYTKRKFWDKCRS